MRVARAIRGLESSPRRMQCSATKKRRERRPAGSPPRRSAGRAFQEKTLPGLIRLRRVSPEIRGGFRRTIEFLDLGSPQASKAHRKPASLPSEVSKRSLRELQDFLFRSPRSPTESWIWACLGPRECIGKHGVHPSEVPKRSLRELQEFLFRFPRFHIRTLRFGPAPGHVHALNRRVFT